jgi:excisionase family DNA binding protein
MAASSQATITPRLLNIKEAAKYLSCAVWQLRHLEWAGELPSVRNLGKRILFDRADLDRLVDQRKTESR